MGRPPGVSPRNSAYGRLWIALGGSALLHLVGASTLGIEYAPRSAPGNGVSIPITVQLERAPAALAATMTAHAEPRPGAGPERHSRVGDSASARECCSGPSALLSAPADPTVYPAADLDTLPTPVAPLDLARLRELVSAALVRMELTIDEHGTVHAISIDEASAGVLREQELRTAIAATIFVPARKDGRAVKSRIVLGLQAGSERRSPERPKSVNSDW